MSTLHKVCFAVAIYIPAVTILGFMLHWKVISVWPRDSERDRARRMARAAGSVFFWLLPEGEQRAWLAAARHARWGLGPNLIRLAYYDHLETEHPRPLWAPGIERHWNRLHYREKAFWERITEASK